MTLLIFSDIHADTAALQKLMNVEADHYFAAGDLVNWGEGLSRMGPLFAPHAQNTYVLPGNHESAEDIAAFCAEFKMHDFHGRVIEVGGYRVAGLGYSNRTPFNTPGEYSEAELAEHLSKFSGPNLSIVICHCPPKGTPLDRVRDGVHYGSQAVRDFIEREQPDYFFCGHIHEAAGATTTIGQTQCWNVGKKGYLLTVPSIM